MRTIGFSKENDKRVVKEEYLDQESSYSTYDIKKEELEGIIAYLDNADSVFSITLAVFIDGNYIGPYQILADGDWIWPNYFKYNLLKTGRMRNDFYNHLKQKKFKIRSLTPEQKKQITVTLERDVLNIRRR